MTPEPPAPAPERPLTVKQQRAEQRARKTAEFKKREAKRKRNRLIGIWSAVVGGVAIVALLIVSFVLVPKPATYSEGGTGAEIEGVETFDNVTEHVETAVDYPQDPPAGGAHHPYWLNCGVYEEPVPSENAVHSLEHGAIWVTYDPELGDEELSTLKTKLPSTYVILSPYEGIDSPIALSGWNAQLKVDSADDPRIAEFFEEYWKSQNVPEVGAACTGAYDAPGKVS